MGRRVSPPRLISSICPRRLDLHPLLLEICETFVESFQSQQVRVDVDVPTNLWVDLDPILIRDALRKILDNAVEAMPHGGTLTITSMVTRRGLEIELADTGTGIPEEIAERMFEPFVSGKRDHAGLGLAMVREIVEAHQGSIHAADCPEGGAAFTLIFPMRSAQRMAA